MQVLKHGNDPTEVQVQVILIRDNIPISNHK